MRRVHRQPLPARAQTYLNRKCQATVGAANVEAAWNAARQTRTFGAIVDGLRAMAGARERCMYCVDSHGSDIEHFRPKGPYPAHTFVWPNLLLCCTECGRFKGSCFPLSAAGQPLLVDPSVEDPWDSLDFDPDTGNLTARYDAASQAPSAKGESTVEVLHLDRREAMAEGYRRTFRRLADRVHQSLAGGAIDSARLANDLLQADDHGLMGWCFSVIGAQFQPFSQLHLQDPQAWAVCAAAR